MGKKLKKQEFLDLVTKEELEDLYIAKDLSASTIANKFNTYTDYVCQALVLYDIPKKIPQKQIILNLGKDTLTKLYETNSALAISKMYNVHVQYVYEALEYFKIPQKSISEIHNMSSVTDKFKATIAIKNSNKSLIYLCTKEELEKLYSENTMSEIANLFGVSRQEVSKALDFYGIKKRNLKEVHKFSKTLQKYSNTCMEKYGTTNFAKTQAFRDSYYEHMPAIKEKEFQTKKERGTFNSSNPEDAYYEYLKGIYDETDIVRQYRDERYPFCCDFYIKSKDLFIELNLHWVHGGHRFDPNNKEDLTKLSMWQEKAKASKFYTNAIQT